MRATHPGATSHEGSLPYRGFEFSMTSALQREQAAGAADRVTRSAAKPSQHVCRHVHAEVAQALESLDS